MMLDVDDGGFAIIAIRVGCAVTFGGGVIAATVVWGVG